MRQPSESAADPTNPARVATTIAMTGNDPNRQQNDSRKTLARRLQAGTISPDDRVLTTYFGTVLAVSAQGGLIHKEFNPRTATLLLNESGKILTSVSDELEGLRPRLLDAGDEYCIMAGELYLCAQPNGTFGYSSARREWETFRLAPVGELTRAWSAALPSVARKARQRRIPKIIHQTYETATIPDVLADGIDRFRTANPDWQYNYYSGKDCHDFIYEYYGWDVLKTYLSLNPRYGAARADFFRYLCVYQCGGVYLDIKSGPLLSLPDIIRPSDEYLLSRWQNQPGQQFDGWGMHPELEDIAGGEFQNWHVIGSPGHPFLEAVIERVIQNIGCYDEISDGVGKMAALRTTGPIAYTLAIESVRHQHTHRVFDAHAAGIVYELIPRPGVTRRHYSYQTTPLVLDRVSI